MGNSVRSWDDILMSLDLEKVQDEINAVEAGQPPMPDYERQDVRELVLIAAERWLEQDLEEFQMTAVEEPFNIGSTFRGILDIRGRHRGALSAYKAFKGTEGIIDWKTTKGALDADWAARYKYSWQWKLYAAAFPDARLFHYRGISRSGATREVVIEIPDGVIAEAELYLAQIAGMRENLRCTAPWPRKMPSSCKAYGRQCDFWDQCSENLVIPGEIDYSKPLSYSGAETFLLCPEKHRLTQIAGYGEDDETLAFGKAFHRGVAEVYSQAFKIQTTT